VLVAACLVTLKVVSRSQFSSFAAEETVVLVGALAVVAFTNMLLLRTAFRPLERVTQAAREIDPSWPGQRVPVEGERTEAGQLATAINEMLARLETERARSVHRSLQAQEQERLRVARELHDQVGQTLTGVLLQLDRLVKQSPSGMGGEAHEAREAVRACLDDVRRIAIDLRPEALDELGLRSALTELAERMSEQSGIQIRRRVDRSLPALPGEVEVVIYRIAQEALTNVIRHAHTNEVDMVLERKPDRLVLRVLDAGCGLRDEGGDGVGLRGMRERALMVGADLAIENRLDRGVEVRLDVPLREEE
jgi:two-component system, NarL family, sensor histidine kinase UhpB